MRTIKLFEEFQSNDEIHDLCNWYEIKNYTINEDGSIDVDGTVYLARLHMKKIPLKFNYVSGNFIINDNLLTSLEGCPRIVGGNFALYYNRLTSLIGSPEIVGGFFSCENNNLFSLEGCPTKIGDYFNCVGNPVYKVWGLIDDKEYLEMFLDYDMIDGRDLYLSRLNDIRDMMGKPPVTKVNGYNCI